MSKNASQTADAMPATTRRLASSRRVVCRRPRTRTGARGRRGRAGGGYGDLGVGHESRHRHRRARVVSIVSRVRSFVRRVPRIVGRPSLSPSLALASRAVVVMDRAFASDSAAARACETSVLDVSRVAGVSTVTRAYAAYPVRRSRPNARARTIAIARGRTS